MKYLLFFFLNYAKEQIIHYVCLKGKSESSGQTRKGKSCSEKISDEKLRKSQVKDDIGLNED